MKVGTVPVLPYSIQITDYIRRVIGPDTVVPYRRPTQLCGCSVTCRCCRCCWQACFHGTRSIFLLVPKQRTGMMMHLAFLSGRNMPVLFLCTPHLVSVVEVSSGIRCTDYIRTYVLSPSAAKMMLNCRQDTLHSAASADVPLILHTHDCVTFQRVASLLTSLSYDDDLRESM